MDHLFDELPHLTYGLGLALHGDGFLQHPQFDLGEGQGLADMIVQVRGQAPPLALFCQG